MTYSLDPLWQILAIDSPSGDEGPLADFLAETIQAQAPGVTLERWGDSLIALKGDQPAVAIFAHTDTTGFTLGYGGELIPIGGPDPKNGDALKAIGQTHAGHTISVNSAHDDEYALRGGPEQLVPGTRWVYATEPRRDGDEIIAPYLDNKGGVWAALTTLLHTERVAVAFTTGEESSGHGARVCARRLFEQYGITQALISDLTWDTEHVHAGQGVAISLRDRNVPRQRYLERVLAIADASGVPYQKEIESSGGSDGSYLLRGAYPIDWVFVGAPEHDPHTSSERVHIADLMSMVRMQIALIEGLSA